MRLAPLMAVRIALNAAGKILGLGQSGGVLPHRGVEPYELDTASNLLKQWSRRLRDRSSCRIAMNAMAEA